MDGKNDTIDFLALRYSDGVILGRGRTRTHGRQRGSIVVHGPSFVGYWSEEVLVGGRHQWKRRSKALCRVSAGQEEARRLLDKILALVNIPGPLPEFTVALEQFWTVKFSRLHLPHLKPSSQLHYATIWNSHIKPFIGTMYLCDITYDVVQKLIEYGFASLATGQPTLPRYEARHGEASAGGGFRAALNLSLSAESDLFLWPPQPDTPPAFRRIRGNVHLF